MQHIAIGDLSDDRQRSIQVRHVVLLIQLDRLDRILNAAALIVVFARQLLVDLRAHPVLGEGPPEIQFLLFQALERVRQVLRFAVMVRGVPVDIGQVRLPDDG